MLANTTGQNGGRLTPGNQTTHIQTLNMHVQGTDSGNSTSYLVPPQGITIISDIDDILRVTKIWDPAEGLMNSFARPFTPWMNMPDVYAQWAQTIEDLHFHYLTTTPEQVTRNYMECVLSPYLMTRERTNPPDRFIFKTYPLGSFDARPLNFSDVAATLSIRRHLLDRIFQTFPQRKFILVGDTSNSDVLKAYPQLARDYADQVQCIWLRNTSSTDASMWFPYDTSGFRDLPQSQYMFFNVPDDLRGLDVAGGECYNASVPQHVTFDMQGFELRDSAAGATARPTIWWMVAALGTALSLLLY